MIKRKNIKLLKDKNGITLIALVITIIVLIILAGISIHLLLGENGLIKKAQNTKETYTIENIREKLDIVKGSDYIEQVGDYSIDTYFETLEKEKIEPYTITDKQKITDDKGIIEVDNKYSYMVTIENRKTIKIEYEGKVDEIIREPDKVTVTVTGDKVQTNLPATLNANVKVNGENITSGKYIINTIEEELGTEDSLYTEKMSNSNIEVKLEAANTYYIHILTLDKYGRKQETIKGPIQITTKYHKHEGTSSSGGKCYTAPVYHSHSASCYQNQYRTCGTYNLVRGPYTNNNGTPEYEYRCSGCGNTLYLCDGGANSGQTHGTTTSVQVCNKTTSTIERYNMTCGKTETTVEGYIVNY